MPFLLQRTRRTFLEPLLRGGLVGNQNELVNLAVQLFFQTLRQRQITHLFLRKAANALDRRPVPSLQRRILERA